MVDTTNLGWGVFRAEGITNVALIALVRGSSTLVAQPRPVGVLRNSTEQNRWTCARSIFRCQQTSKFEELTGHDESNSGPSVGEEHGPVGGLAGQHLGFCWFYLNAYMIVYCCFYDDINGSVEITRW